MTHTTSRRNGLFGITVTEDEFVLVRQCGPKQQAQQLSRTVSVHNLYWKHKAESKLEMAKHLKPQSPPPGQYKATPPSLPKQPHQPGIFCLHSYSNPTVSLSEDFQPPTQGENELWCSVAEFLLFTPPCTTTKRLSSLHPSLRPNLQSLP